jgi:hypothetical protein
VKNEKNLKKLRRKDDRLNSSKLDLHHNYTHNLHNTASDHGL